VFGGTFDPIHYAHLALAEEAAEVLGLERVLFIPAGTFMLRDFFTLAGGIIITLLLWALVPLAVIGTMTAPTPLNLNVNEVGGGK